MRIVWPLKPRILLGVLLTTVLGANWPVSAERKSAITAEQILEIRIASDVQLSPNGEQIAFVVTEPAARKSTNGGQTNIWLVPADGSRRERQLESSSGTDRSPRWSPDDHTLAFLSARENPGMARLAPAQVYLQSDKSGRTERLTHIEGGVEQFRWSPDGKMIAFIASHPLAGNERNLPPGDDAALVGGGSYKSLWVTTIASRSTVQVTHQDFNVYDFAWSPDGDQFALEIASDRNSDASAQLALVVARRSNGKLIRTLANEVGFSGAIQWSPDGRLISFFAATPRRIPCWLAIVSADGGTPRLLLKDYPGTIVDATWSADSKQLLAEMMEGTGQALLEIDPSNDTPWPVAKILNMPEFNSSFSSSRSSTAYLNQTFDSPNDIWAITPNHVARKLTSLNPEVSTWRLGNVRQINWMNTKDGARVNGVLITPPDFEEGHPYPTVVQTHPGWIAWWAGWQGSWWAWGQLLATHGYVIFLPNYRGAWGQGWQWFDALADWGGMSIQDLNDGIDYLVQQKIADPDRLGIGGWSNGGFVAAAAITHTSRFKAAILDAPVTDFYSCQAMPSCTFLRVHLGDNPYYQRSKYDEHSPMTFIRNCRTPTLLLHGQEDEAVPIGQSYEFYYGLLNLGVEAKMVVYPREGHSIEERAHQLDLQDRALNWFDSHLKNR
jgi:dipeptidyl aminopeptidase/acylaminoacyl peptidase